MLHLIAIDITGRAGLFFLSIDLNILYLYCHISVHKGSCSWQPFKGIVGRVFANGPVDLGSIPGRVIPKTLKMVLDTSLLNTQQYKVCIKGKVEKSRERSSALPDTSVYSLLKRETSGRPRLRSPTLLTLYYKSIAFYFIGYIRTAYDR